MACCMCCRQAFTTLCRFCSTLSMAVFVLFAALWCQSMVMLEPEDGVHHNSAAAALPEIPRFKSSEISFEQFFEEHVRRGIPALIQLQPPRYPSLLDKLLASDCADRKLELISQQQKSVLQTIQHPSLPLWKYFAANLLILLVSGTTAEGWHARRRVSLRELSAGDASTGTRPLPFGSTLLEHLARATGNELIKAVSTMGKLISQPVYLADKHWEDICPEILQPIVQETSLYEAETVRKIGDQVVQPWRNLTLVDFSGLDHESDVKVFFGGPKSYSYPLHRDVSDGDVVCMMFSGCKDIAILRPESRHKLTRLHVPGFEEIKQFTWSYDLYSDGPLEGIRGWHGTVRAGELMYMPGEMLHHIRNSCKQSLSLCGRPWRASFARDIFMESLKTVRLTAESDVDEEKSLEALYMRRLARLSRQQHRSR